MFAKVIVDITHSKVDKIFEYKIKDDQNAALGYRVLVPFGISNKLIEGFIIGVTGTTDFDESKIKYIHSLMDSYPVLKDDQIALAHFFRDEYGCTLADVFRLMLPGRLHGLKEKMRLKARIVKEDTSSFYTNSGKVKAQSQLKVYDYLKLQGNTFLSDIEKSIPGCQSAVKALKDKGIIEVYGEEIHRTPYRGVDSEWKQVELTHEQKHVVETVWANLFSGKTYLLHGVTGSGKTEVYMRIVQKCLAKNCGAIILVPEIALTPQAVERYRAAFGSQVALLHSRLSPGERFDQWKQILVGNCKVVLGPRSAIFAPVDNLAVVIVDEEHEGTYQSDTFPRYDARAVAAYRIKDRGCLVMGSATPSVESYYRAVHGKTGLLELTKRANNMPLPTTYVVDMAKELLEGNKTIISNYLFERITDKLNKSEQIVLLLNKRGYASFVMCRGCGHVLKCSHCDVSLAYHRTDGSKVKCHYCNSEEKVTRVCPSCGRPFMKYFGIGTQQVEEQVKKLFPSARTLRMDFDTTRKKDSHYEIFNSFINGRADILIGTQMIAKGLDFPSVTLVGIVCADNMFNLPDYRARERAFSLITQASGRAGRDKMAGEVVVQTYIKNNPTLSFAINQDYKGFYNYEIGVRSQTNYPPFAVFCRIVVQSLSNDDAFDAVKELNKRVFDVLTKAGDDKLLYSCSPCPIGYLKDMHRYQVLIKLRENDNSRKIVEEIRNIIKNFNFKKNVYGDFEINPKNML